MNKELFYERYRRFNETDEDISKYIDTILYYESFSSKVIENTTVEDIVKYSKHLIDQDINIYNNYIHIARYYYYIDYKEHHIHMTKYFNTYGVLENIIDRITLFESSKIKDAVMNEVELPQFGTESSDLPEKMEHFLETLNKYIDCETCDKILAGNNHQIPKETFKKEKELYQQSSSLEDYLKDRHNRKVQELQDHLDNNKIWYEQVISKEVVNHVKSNQEILSGVLKDDKLYITKIPYDVGKYLSAKDDTEKRYHACHCTFVRENIKDEKYDIPHEWCYCSAGFAKFPFEVILDQELDITLLKTPINGDDICRFEIDLSNIEYKKKPM